jgi:glyoxylase-like metal-dependent hydrolase (beta-lactamase superfamily II)
VRVSEHCYAVTGLGCILPWTVNAGFVVGRDATLIADTGANTQAARTIHGYATAARPSNRLVVLNTERHFDHIGGNGYFHNLGVDVFGHPDIRRTPEEFSAEIDEYNQTILNPTRRSAREAEVFFTDTTLVNPKREIREGTRFDLGELTAEIILTPGHTPTNISVWIPGDAALFCGDCLVSGYIPNLDAGGVTDWRTWLGSLDRIERLAPRVVIPGHGAVAPGDEVPRLIASLREVLQESIARGSSPTRA